MQRTWMVLGAGTPTFHHTTLKAAMDEAERLARVNQSQTFTVLEAIARCRYSSVAWENADETDDMRGTTEIPF